MSLSQKNLSSIQKAGQAVHGASEAIAATVRTQAESMVASVSSQPFGDASEQLIARFKILSRLSQGLVEVEAKLQELYAMAFDLASPATYVTIAKSAKQQKVTNSLATDVVVKHSRAANVAPGKKGGRKPATLTANDSILLKYLKSALKSDEWTYQTGPVIAAGSGLPLGSVGVSLKKVLATGSVKLGERGMYKLDSATVSHEAESAPAKKFKRATAKKGKVANTNAATSKVLKVKPGKRVQTAASKNGKIAMSKKINPKIAQETVAPSEPETALV